MIVHPFFLWLDKQQPWSVFKRQRTEVTDYCYEGLAKV